MATIILHVTVRTAISFRIGSQHVSLPKSPKAQPKVLQEMLKVVILRMMVARGSVYLDEGRGQEGVGTTMPIGQLRLPPKNKTTTTELFGSTVDSTVVLTALYNRQSRSIV